MTDPISKLHSPTGTLLSVYVNRRPPATRAALVDLVRSLPSAPADRTAEKALKVDIARVVDLAGRIDSEASPAVAVFASHADGIFEYLALTHPVDETAAIGPRPLMRPLRARPRPYRAGVVVADTTTARTHLSTGGGFHEIGDELTVDHGKDNYGGFGGYEEHRTRARADELSAKLWRQAGRRLLEAHQDQPLDLIVVGGHEEMLDAIAAQFHAYLQALPSGQVVMDPRSLTDLDLASAVAVEVDRQRGRRAQALLDRLLAEVDRDGDAVTGLAPVLAACNVRAVDHLLVSGPYCKPGVVCDSCGWLGRTGSECPVCATLVFAVADVVSAAMDATVEAGGRVDIVDIASRLDADGVGALLRFPLAT